MNDELLAAVGRGPRIRLPRVPHGQIPFMQRLGFVVDVEAARGIGWVPVTLPDGWYVDLWPKLNKSFNGVRIYDADGDAMGEIFGNRGHGIGSVNTSYIYPRAGTKHL